MSSRIKCCGSKRLVVSWIGRVMYSHSMREPGRKRPLHLSSVNREKHPRINHSIGAHGKLQEQRWQYLGQTEDVDLLSVAFAAGWMATRTTSHTTKSITTMSQHPETVVNFNQKPPRKRKAQEPGAQEEQPASKRRKQVCLSPKTDAERSLIVSELHRTTQLLRHIGQVSDLFTLLTRRSLNHSV